MSESEAAATQSANPPANSTAIPAPPVVANGIDLPHKTQLEEVIQQQGGRAVLVTTPDELVAAVDYHFPVLVLVDLGLPGDWAGAIQRCKLRPHTKQIPLYAYDRDGDSPTFADARRAGADHTWARAKLMAELPALVARQIHPPVRYLDGWDDALPAQALQGVAEFNAGHYLEQHEYFEEAWIAEPRPIRDLYQGVLQVGLAFLQIELGNWAGTLKMFRRGLPRLRELPPVCQGINVANLRTVAEEIHREVTELGPTRLAEFDQARFPKVEMVK